MSEGRETQKIWVCGIGRLWDEVMGSKEQKPS